MRRCPFAAWPKKFSARGHARACCVPLPRNEATGAGAWDLSEIEITAIVVVVGYVLTLLRAWVRERGRVQTEQCRGTVRRDIVRSLPPGSRVSENAEGTMIEVGLFEKKADRGEGSCG